MSISEEIRKKLITTFRAEQREHVMKITQGLLALENDPQNHEQQIVLDEIFRSAHSLKGSARAVGMTMIASLGHGLEELLLLAKKGKLSFSPELFDLLFQTLDAVEFVVGQIDTPNSTPPARVLAILSELEEAVAKAQLKPQTPLAAPEPTVEFSQAEPVAPLSSNGTAGSLAPDGTIRVSVAKLDAFMSQLHELVGTKLRFEQHLAAMHNLSAHTNDWQKTWFTSHPYYNRLLQNGEINPEQDVTDLLAFDQNNQERLRTFQTDTNHLFRQFSNDMMRMSQVIKELESEIKRVRMLPLSTITTSFSRMVRDLARSQNKQIRFTITGGETELDRHVLEQIKDPMIHLLRNAVDHGIEPAEKRTQQGKELEGQITLSAEQQGNQIMIAISDDGSGLDLNAIQETAKSRGMVFDPDKMSESELASLIYETGFSTSKVTTDISGRGVGLDVVRQNIESLHGSLSVDFLEGQSTTFTLSLPLTLASSRGLLVKAGGQTFALPFTAVVRILQISRDQISRLGDRQAIQYENRPVILASLGELMELTPTNPESENLAVVLLQIADKHLGLIVDELEGEQEIVSKGLGKLLAKIGGISGATILGTMEIVLVLHPADLLKLAMRQTPSRRVQTRSDTPVINSKAGKTILIVDDSITTRTLEKNILEAAGYEVSIAMDGREALNKLFLDGVPDLIVTDIEMPHMDGFELTSQLKRDANYKDIPIILVSSLDSPESKAKGITVGADAYIVKNSFDQGSLLETITQLIR